MVSLEINELNGEPNVNNNNFINIEISCAYDVIGTKKFLKLNFTHKYISKNILWTYYISPLGIISRDDFDNSIYFCNYNKIEDNMYEVLNGYNHMWLIKEHSARLNVCKKI